MRGFGSTSLEASGRVPSWKGKAHILYRLQTTKNKQLERDVQAFSGDVTAITVL
jgi:hypothetical protein